MFLCFPSQEHTIRQLMQQKQTNIEEAVNAKAGILMNSLKLGLGFWTWE